jgi:hypothetical protein
MNLKPDPETDPVQNKIKGLPGVKLVSVQSEAIRE